MLTLFDINKKYENFYFSPFYSHFLDKKINLNLQKKKRKTPQKKQQQKTDTYSPHTLECLTNISTCLTHKGLNSGKK